MKSIAITVTIVLSSLMHVTYAQTVTQHNDRGDTFAEQCRAAVKFQRDGVEGSVAEVDKEMLEMVADVTGCYQYLRGFIEGHNMAADHSPSAMQFCIPAGVNHIQLARIIVNASDKYPEIAHHPRETLVEAALKQAFPCK